MKTIKFIFIFSFCFSLSLATFAQETNFSFSVTEKNEDSAAARQIAELKLVSKFVNAIYDEISYKKLFENADLLLPANKEKIKELIRKDLVLQITEEWNKKRCILKSEYSTKLDQLAQKIETEFLNPPAVHGKAMIQIESVSTPEPVKVESHKPKILPPEEAKAAENYFVKALESHELGLYDKAIDYYKKGIAIEPSLPEPYFNMGNSYYELGNLNEAIESYQIAIELKKDYPDAYFNMGNAYLDAQDYVQAVVAYQNAITYAPKEAATYYNLGIAYFELGNHEFAVSSLQKAARLGSRDAQIFLSANNITW